MTLRKADQEGYRPPSEAELTVLSEGQDAAAFCVEVLRGAIRALALIATGPPAEDSMLQRLRSFPPGDSQN